MDRRELRIVPFLFHMIDLICLGIEVDAADKMAIQAVVAS
jgi:hypothetical protein